MLYDSERCPNDTILRCRLRWVVSSVYRDKRRKKRHSNVPLPAAWHWHDCMNVQYTCRGFLHIATRMSKSGEILYKNVVTLKESVSSYYTVNVLFLLELLC